MESSSLSVSTSGNRPGRPSVRLLGSRLVRARVLQVALLVGFWLTGEWLSRWMGLGVPGSVLGLFLVLVLLGTGWLPLTTVAHGAKWLLGEMLLFFMPPTLALLDHGRFFGLLGLKLLVAIVAGTLMVMVATAATIELCHRLLKPGEGQ